MQKKGDVNVSKMASRHDEERKVVHKKSTRFQKIFDDLQICKDVANMIGEYWKRKPCAYSVSEILYNRVAIPKDKLYSFAQLHEINKNLECTSLLNLNISHSLHCRELLLPIEVSCMSELGFLEGKFKLICERENIKRNELTKVDLLFQTLSDRPGNPVFFLHPWVILSYFYSYGMKSKKNQIPNH